MAAKLRISLHSCLRAHELGPALCLPHPARPRKEPIQSQWFPLGNSKKGYHAQLRMYPYGSKPAQPGSCSVYIRINQNGQADADAKRADELKPELTLRFTLFLNQTESESLECVWAKVNKDKGKHDLGSLPNTGSVVVGFHLLGISE